MVPRIQARWAAFATKRPAVAQFAVFTVLSVGMTVFQLILMPVIKWLFGMTALVNTGFQVFPVGTNFDGSTYYLFDYAAGALPLGGGGLAYFLAVQITLALAQAINFFAQRNITFKSNSNAWVAAAWYALAYVIISFGAAALQGLYKGPVYELLISTWGLGSSGEALADVITMLINAVISFFVFFPIFKVIFKREPERQDALQQAEVASAR